MPYTSEEMDEMARHFRPQDFDAKGEPIFLHSCDDKCVHPCIVTGCTNIIAFCDEDKCFEHTPW